MKSVLVFDPFSDEFFRDPYETYRRMREEAPVYYDRRHEFYALSRHRDVVTGYRDFETYSSAGGVDLAMVRSSKPPQRKSLILMDPPEHRRMRRLVNKVFTPRAILALETVVTERIERHLAAADPDRFDVAQDFSVLFPAEVIAQMLGVPTEYEQQVRLWIEAQLHRDPGSVEMSQTGMQASMEIGKFYLELIQERRARPRDDMISHLIAVEVERDDGTITRLDDAEIAGFSVLLGGAGAETVAKLVASAAIVFAQHPDQWRALAHDRGKIPGAVEELLRYDAPSQYNVRCSRRDVELHGVTIPAGQPVFLLTGSANRDPEAFPSPDTFDIDRDPNQALNVGFGYGIHTCLGAALARLESRIALDRMLDFMPDYEVIWPDCQRVTMQNVAGWNNVPVRVLR